MFVTLRSVDYGRFLSMTVQKLHALSNEAAQHLHAHLLERSRTLLPTYSRSQSILSSANLLLLRLVCIEDYLLLFLTGDFFYLRHRSAMHYMGFPLRLKRHGEVGSVICDDIERYVSTTPGCTFNFSKFMYSFLYPAIRNITDQCIRIVHINRACNWMESCLLASLPASTVSSVAYREAVCRKAVHLLLEEAQDIVKCALPSQSFGPSVNVLTDAILQSTGMVCRASMNPRSYMLVSLSWRLSKSYNATQRLSASSLLSIAVGTKKSDFTKIVAQTAKYAEDNWESIQSIYGLTHLPLFDGEQAGMALPEAYVEIIQNSASVASTPFDMHSFEVSDLGRSDEIMKCLPWMIEALKKKIVNVFRPASGPSEAHVRILEAFYFLLQVQVGTIQSYEPAKAAMKRVFAAKITKSDLLSLAVFHNSCFMEKQCRQWKLIPLNVLKRILSAELADPHFIASTEQACTGKVVVPDFQFGQKWLEYARNVLNQSPPRRRGRPKRACIGKPQHPQARESDVCESDSESNDDSQDTDTDKS
jgi:hypothetical protein